MADVTTLRRGLGPGALAAVLALVAISVSCSSEQSETTFPTAVVTSSTSTTLLRVEGNGTPVDPARIHVLLDDEGRPYDVAEDGIEDLAVWSEPVTTFHAPDGALRVSAGEAVGYDPQPADPTAVLDPGDDGTLEVSVIEVSLERNDPEAPAQGVRVDVPGSEVERWGPFEAAYVTDGGMGAVMTQAGHDRSASIDSDTVIDALVDDGSLVLRPSNDAPNDASCSGTPGATARSR